MNIEISISFNQLAGNLPIYIKGKRFWLMSDKQHKDLARLKQEARNVKENLQRLVDLKSGRIKP